MTSQDGLDIREVIFINERCRVDYEAMPAEVRESADQGIDALQNARRLPPKWVARWRALMKSDSDMTTTLIEFTST
ncbi:MAG: hypothetical protein ACREVV_04875 [Steroidobacteraceae bacterium]